MNSEENIITYAEYKENVIARLVKIKTWEDDGVYKYRGKYISKNHILPLFNKENSRVKRADAIRQYLGFDCTPYFPKGFIGLHQYAHHLNSSQTFCMMFFSKLMYNNHYATKLMVEFFKKVFLIDIHEGAECNFEYKEDDDNKNHQRYRFKVLDEQEYEGTSFDFHIRDRNIEIFFEIKFTEDGFGKAKKDDSGRHECKAEQYLKLLPQPLKNNVTTDDILHYYQIFRNIIRAENEDKYVIFITDANNPSTKKDKCEFMEKFGKYLDSKHIIFETWQNLAETYQHFEELPFQLKAILEHN